MYYKVNILHPYKSFFRMDSNIVFKYKSTLESRYKVKFKFIYVYIQQDWSSITSKFRAENFQCVFRETFPISGLLTVLT